MQEDIESCDFSTRTRSRSTTSEAARTVRAQAVIISTGATANWLGLDNEMRLAQQGGGVSACAVCDGALPMFRDAHLAVVGGGDSAMEEATYLTKFAKKVTVIHRRDELRASKIMQERFMSKENGEVVWNKQVVDVIGDEKIEAVKLEDTQTGEESTMEVGGCSSRSVTRRRRSSWKARGCTSTRRATSSREPCVADEHRGRLRGGGRRGREVPPGGDGGGDGLPGGARRGALAGGEGAGLGVRHQASGIRHQGVAQGGSTAIGSVGLVLWQCMNSRDSRGNA